MISGIIVPLSYLIPQRLTGISREVSWFVPFLSLFVCALFSIMYYHLTKDGIPLATQYETALGKLFSKFILLMYLVWVLLFITSLLLFHASRMISTTYVDTSPNLFLVCLLILSTVFASRKIAPLGRMAEVFFYVISFTVITIFVLSLSQLNITNLFPVSSVDAIPLLYSSKSYLSFVSSIFFFLFLAHRADGIKKRSFFHCFLVIAAVSTVLLFCIIGLFGATLSSNLTNPFFFVIKSISISNVIERFEAVIISVFVVTEVVNMTGLLMVCTTLIERIFGIKDASSVCFFISLLCYVLSTVLVSSVYELQELCFSVFEIVNPIFTLLLPLLVLCVNKLKNLRRHS